MAPNTTLNVTIIGAGIAGLFAARVLREKHNVTILERSSGGNEVGAAVSPGPNAVQWLAKYGWDPEKAAAISLKNMRTLDHKDVLVEDKDLSHHIELFGSDWYVVHRIDLWTELLRLATAPSAKLGVSGSPAKVVWRANVSNVDVESGDVLLDDGTVIQSDLVIGADGVKSEIRPLVTGKATQPRATGTSAFRFVLPRDIVECATNNTAIAGLMSRPECNIRFASDGSGRLIVSYPCRNFKLLNVGCIFPNSLVDLPVGNSWSAPGNREDLLRVFGDFSVRPILEKAKDIKLWELRDHDPLQTYVRGRTVLIGDAAHAMSPRQGQGLSQAIEDGEGLSLFIDQTVTREAVPDVLRDFDRVRRVRASKVQEITRWVDKEQDPKAIMKKQQYNHTYGGIRDSLARLDEGKEI